MTETFAIAVPRVFDGTLWHERAAVIVDGDLVAGVARRADLHPDLRVERLTNGLLAPGFVDLQVNGGGGVLFNDAPGIGAIKAISAAHLKRGTTSMLVTLISDTGDKIDAAISAAVAAQEARVPGFLGLHLEGPHLGPTRSGAHDASLFRPMSDADLGRLLAAKARLDVLMATVAPEAVTLDQIAALAKAGIIVSLGHSAATFEAARRATEAGARSVTHLFNAMSPLTHRAPGLVGAALEIGQLSASLIADGIHVSPAALAIAIRAKRGPGKLFLVSDAMPTVGSDKTEFNLAGRKARLEDGRLRFADGTLAGAHLDMAGAVRFIHQHVGIETGEALRMATAYPAEVALCAGRVGTLVPGARADLLHLADDLTVEAVWSGGVRR